MEKGEYPCVAKETIIAIILQPKWLPFKKHKTAVVAVLLLMMQSYSASPEPIKYGVAACDFCKMTIMDKKFACEWVTDKNKVYRFDDLHCMVSFRKTNNSKGTAYINDFTNRKELVKATKLFFVKSEELKAPMGGNIAAFVDKAEADAFAKNNQGKSLSWEEVEKEMSK